MKVICAWCYKKMGEKAPLDNKDPTHGICKDCTDELRRNYKMSYPAELDFSGTAKEFVEKIRSK